MQLTDIVIMLIANQHNSRNISLQLMPHRYDTVLQRWSKKRSCALLTEILVRGDLRTDDSVTCTTPIHVFSDRC